MISAENAIRTLRRDLTISSVLKGLLFGGVFVITVFGQMLGVSMWVVAALVGLAVAWMVASFRTARGSSLGADSPALIASGQLDEAEEEIEKVLRSFWLFRSVKIMGLHHLAVLRHTQRRWRESALLSQALIRQKMRGMPGIARANRLMLADSLLELGDLDGAHHALLSLYHQKVTLTEAINLLVVQLDYEARVGAWEAMFHNIAQKVQLAELMPTTSTARSQAMLALAAGHVGRQDWADWLRRRVELLTDINELTTHRPMLKELWK